MHIRRGDSCSKGRYCPANLTSSYFAAAARLRAVPELPLPPPPSEDMVPAPAAQAPPPPAAKKRASRKKQPSAKQRLAELSDLLEMGLVTQEEYEEKRAAILTSL